MFDGVSTYPPLQGTASSAQKPPVNLAVTRYWTGTGTGAESGTAAAGALDGPSETDARTGTGVPSGRSQSPSQTAKLRNLMNWSRLGAKLATSEPPAYVVMYARVTAWSIESL